MIGAVADAHIDLDALRHNLGVVRAHAPNSRVMAVVKANAYGHGIVDVAKTLATADGLAVARLDEARILRQAGITLPITVLEGFSEPAELPLLAANDIAAVVHHADQVDMLEQVQLSRPLGVWLKIDSGMHRLGVLPEQAAAMHNRLQRCAAVAQPVHLLTHLANADDRRDDTTPRQLTCFEQVVCAWPGERSIANSAGLMAWPATRNDWVRPGIMLYGVSPFPGDTGATHGLRPVMTLRSRLIAVNNYRKGDAIGYGGSWVCPEDMPVGVVAIGYGDGYPRHAPPGTPVLVNGQRAPLVGRVSMDMICVDLRVQSRARRGDPVVLWGEGLPVEEIARASGTLPYELLCRVNPRRVPAPELSR